MQRGEMSENGGCPPPETQQGVENSSKTLNVPRLGPPKGVTAEEGKGSGGEAFDSQGQGVSGFWVNSFQVYLES